MTQVERKRYLDGLKGMACVLIMIGHYAGLYRYAQDPSALSGSFVEILCQFPFSFLSDGSFWMYLFLVVSGYQLASSRVSTLTDLLCKCILCFLQASI